MKLPADAFDFYFSLGHERSYQAVADQYGVSKRAVTKRATKEGWQDRLTRIEAEARERSDQKMVETMEQMTARHLKAVKIVQGKALEALRGMSLSTAMEAVRALDIAIKAERTSRGEPANRTAVSVEETIKREMKEWLVLEEGADDQEESSDGPG